MLGRMNTAQQAQQAQRSVAVGSMHDMTALQEVALPLARRRMVVSCLPLPKMPPFFARR